jgi:hypothetical protein
MKERKVGFLVERCHDSHKRFFILNTVVEIIPTKYSFEWKKVLHTMVVCKLVYRVYCVYISRVLALSGFAANTSFVHKLRDENQKRATASARKKNIFKFHCR